MSEKTNLVVVTGPTAVGKTGVVKTAIADRKDELAQFITTMDRPLRDGEIHGEHYYKVLPYQFQEKRLGDMFFEYEEVFNSGWYGCERFELKRIAESNKQAIIVVDVNGALKFLGKRDQGFIDLTNITAEVVYITAPKEQLIERLYKDVAEGKRKNDPEDIRKRIERLDYELAQQKHFANVISNANGQLTFAVNTFINEVQRMRQLA